MLVAMVLMVRPRWTVDGPWRWQRWFEIPKNDPVPPRLPQGDLSHAEKGTVLPVLGLGGDIASLIE